MHLGNVDFVMDEDNCVAKDDKSKLALAFVANELQIEKELLNDAICKQHMHVHRKIIVKTQTIDQAKDKRDALAKTLYSKLFLWLIKLLNTTISYKGASGTIGVLDIYGFEKFEWNTFEQLLINYANEKLQGHFNHHILQAEQQIYQQENIEWNPVAFHDNADCLQLIEGKNKPGILNCLDDVWRLQGEQANVKFVTHLHSNFGRTHDYYIQPKMDNRLRFGIKHYAGKVVYDASGFNDKNNENLSQDIRVLLTDHSESALVKEMFLQTVEMDAKPRRKLEKRASSRTLRELSIGNQFRNQLQELMRKIQVTKPWYIRCIKPNDDKNPNNLQADECSQQLRYSGMLEAIRIRQAGYATRVDHEIFFDEYASLDLSANTLEELVASISKKMQLDDQQWQIGKTQIFLKQKLSIKLDKLNEIHINAAAKRIQRWFKFCITSHRCMKIQSIVRMYIAKRQFKRAVRSANLLVRCCKGFATRSMFLKHRHIHRIHMRSSTTIQRFARGYIIRKFPLQHWVPREFEGVDRKELDAMAKEVSNTITQASKAKDFNLCIKLEKRLSKIKLARQSVRSVPELDAAIKALNTELQAATANKKFEDCARLHGDILKLQTQRDATPEDYQEMSAPELDGILNALQEKLKNSTIAKNFVQCAKIQTKIDVVLTHRSNKKSPTEIASAIRSVNAALESAISSKDFKRCSELQDQLQNLKALQDENSPIAANVSPKVEKQIGASAAILVAGHQAISCGATIVSEPLIKATIATPKPLQHVNSDVGSPIQPRIAKPSSPASHRKTTVASSRKVAMLRPTDALKVRANMKVSEAVSILADHRADAAVVVSEYGELLGIITDTDITRRVVAKLYDTTEILVEDAMTSNVQHVAPEDAAIQALKLMLSGKFRHLPVVGNDGTVCGMLCIAKCLYDAIQKLEHSANASLVSYFCPTLESILLEEGNAKNLTLAQCASSYAVAPSDTVQKAAVLMSSTRKSAVLVIDEAGLLVGIFTTKDLLSRVLSKGMAPTKTMVYEVMTKNPDVAKADMTVLDGLHILQDGRFLNLPVSLSNSLYGLVDVLSMCFGMFSADDWDRFWNVALDMADVESVCTSNSASMSRSDKRPMRSETCLAQSEKSFARSIKSSAKSKKSVATSGKSMKIEKHNEKLLSDNNAMISRPVSKLRPSPAVTIRENNTISEGAKEMMKHRSDSALVVNENGYLTGIITDTDILRRVIAQNIDPTIANVCKFMTKNPEFVAPNDSAMDAMCKMLTGRFRHLPVVGEDGTVAGVLNIGKCLFDAIRRMENAVEKNNNSPMLTKMLEGVLSPSLAMLIQLRNLPEPIIVPCTESVASVARSMGKKSSAVMVSDSNGRSVIGIFTSKDLLLRVVGMGLSLETTLMDDVMTRSPEVASNEMKLVDAMHLLYEQNYQHLPVSSNNGSLVGLLDILDISYGSFQSGKEWKHFWDASLQLDAPSEHSSKHPTSAIFKKSNLKGGKQVSHLRPQKVLELNITHTIKEAAWLMRRTRCESAVVLSGSGTVIGIVTDTDMVRRAISQELDVERTSIETIMTRNPKYALASDDAGVALDIMIQGRFKHLPVISDDSTVVGMLDIAKCLYDAISRLEKANQMASSSIGTMMERLLSPTLDIALQGEPLPPVIDKNTNLVSVAKMMAESRKAAIVVEDSEVVGIITFKNLVMGTIAMSKEVFDVSVEQVMTEFPPTMRSDNSVMDALHVMHDNHEYFVPVLTESDKILGMVDVLCLAFGSTDEAGVKSEWQNFWKSAMALQDEESILDESQISEIDFDDGVSIGTIAAFERDEKRQLEDTFLFKIKESGHVHRIRCSYSSFQHFVEAIGRKINGQVGQISYKDDDDDIAIISSDESLLEAVQMAQGVQWSCITLLVRQEVSSPPAQTNSSLNIDKFAIAASLAAIAGVAAFALLKSK